jgi:quercetin dioxygenase-like cupin family protein
MTYKVVDAKDVEARKGVFRLVRRALGVTAFGINQVDLPPNTQGHEHDETGSGQEEVYLTLAGSGVLRVDGTDIEMHPGRYVLVSPESTRLPIAGPEGLSWVCLGGVPGGAYVVREPF